MTTQRFGRRQLFESVQQEIDSLGEPAPCAQLIKQENARPNGRLQATLGAYYKQTQRGEAIKPNVRKCTAMLKVADGVRSRQRN